MHKSSGDTSVIWLISFVNRSIETGQYLYEYQTANIMNILMYRYSYVLVVVVVVVPVTCQLFGSPPLFAVFFPLIHFYSSHFIIAFIIVLTNVN